MRHWCILLFAATSLCAMPMAVYAHALGVAWTRIGARIEVEAFYDDDSPAANAKVALINDKEEVLASQITDEEGKCSFKAPPPGQYEVRVDAGAGHRARKALKIDPPPVDEKGKAAVTSVESREEQTRTPWLAIGMGLTIIAAGSGALVLGLMWSKRLLGVRSVDEV